MPIFKDLYDERDLLASVRGGDFYLEFVRGASGFGYFSAGTAQALADWIKANVPGPKPEWHNAKPWETWVFIIDGEEHARTLDEDREFRDPLYPKANAWVHVTDPRITAARRIYPEGE